MRNFYFRNLFRWSLKPPFFSNTGVIVFLCLFIIFILKSTFYLIWLIGFGVFLFVNPDEYNDYVPSEFIKLQHLMNQSGSNLIIGKYWISFSTLKLDITNSYSKRNQAYYDALDLSVDFNWMVEGDIELNLLHLYSNNHFSLPVVDDRFSLWVDTSEYFNIFMKDLDPSICKQMAHNFNVSRSMRRNLSVFSLNPQLEFYPSIINEFKEFQIDSESFYFDTEIYLQDVFDCYKIKH